MNKRLKYGLNATILTIIVIGIVVLLNILLSKYSYRKDITENRTYQLSEDTKSVLQRLDSSGKIINVYLFKSGNVMYENVIDLRNINLIERILKQYDIASKNLKLNIVDIEKNPSIARKYNVNFAYDVAFECDGRTKVISYVDTYDGTSFNGEQAYTSAIIYVMNENPSVVYFIQGHKEVNIDRDMQYLKRQIERQGYVIKTLNIALEGKIPDDASMIIDVGAKSEFAQKEIDVLKQYLDNGGKAIFLTPSFNEDATINSLNKMFNSYGININDDIVIDSSRNFLGIKNLIIPIYKSHEIVNKLNEQNQYYMVIPDPRSISVSKNINNINVVSLLETSPNSWGETNITQYENNQVKLDNTDNKGPLTLAVYATKTVPKNKQMELVVLGNYMFVLDAVYDNTRSGANIDFILNSMGVLSPKQQLVTIKPKPLDIKYIILPSNERKILFFTLVLLIPAAVLLTGLIVWLRRRHL